MVGSLRSIRWVFAVSLLAGGCGETGQGDTETANGDDDGVADDTSLECTPGERIECGCDAGGFGYQVCLPGGAELGPCQCDGEPTGGFGSASMSSTSGDTGETSGDTSGSDDATSEGTGEGTAEGTAESTGGDTGTGDGSESGSDEGGACPDAPEGYYGNCGDASESVCGDTTAECLENGQQTISVCSRTCEEVCDCWDRPVGGTATVFCDAITQGGEQKYCALDCSDGKECPEGMVCYGNVEICVWEAGGGGGSSSTTGGTSWTSGGSTSMSGGTGGWTGGSTSMSGGTGGFEAASTTTGS